MCKMGRVLLRLLAVTIIVLLSALDPSIWGFIWLTGCTGNNTS